VLGSAGISLEQAIIVKKRVEGENFFMAFSKALLFETSATSAVDSKLNSYLPFS